jgi:hypothetical protein
MERKMIIRFVHAFPNAWLPIPGKLLVQRGVSASDLAEMCSRKEVEIVSHVRYEDHCQRISEELGIQLTPSGVNCPNPFNSKGLFVVASLTPGTTDISYVMAFDGTDAIKEADVRF